MSIDIVGSTAHKQRTVFSNGDDHAHPWLKTFTEFYSKVDGWVQEEWQALPLRVAASGRPPDEVEALKAAIARSRPPSFFKAIGDEVVYETRVNDLRLAAPLVELFRRVLRNVQSDLEGLLLTGKATAWLAGFPVTNSEVVIGDRADRLHLSVGARGGGDPDWFFRHFLRCHLHEVLPDKAERLDFLGPQMDLGFRLTAFATPRRMAISLDLAWVPAWGARGWRECADFDFSNQVHFDDAHPLKGILGGIPYPIFWLDCGFGRPLFAAHDRLTAHAAVAMKDLCEYHDAFVDEFGRRFSWLTKPFLIGVPGQDAGFGPYHRKRIAWLENKWKREVKRVFKELPKRGTPTPGALALLEAFADSQIGALTDGLGTRPGPKDGE